MKYKPGGYSWMAVAPESQFELEIEKLEDRINTLKKEYELNKDDKFLSEIKELELAIAEKRKQVAKD